MKINISIMTWINRFLMIPFGISLLIGCVYFDLLFYAACIAFIVGAFQLFSFLMTLLYHNKIKNSIKRLLLIYGAIVALYFVSFYILSEFFNVFKRIEILLIVYWMLPVVLSIFWSYILESLKKEA